MKLFIIVRGAKERTETLCVQIAKILVGNDNVVLLNEPSFAEAHIKSMEIAASLKGYDYVIFLDADILLIQENFLATIKKGLATVKDKKFYMLNYQIFDRQCSTPVYGMHLYNIESLKKALPYKHIALGAQRPETAVCVQMAKKGYKTYITPHIIGFHGYEQYYLDMYRTAYVRGVKYKGHWDFYLPTFYKNKDVHPDYFWCYLGLIDGIISYSQGNSNASLAKKDYIRNFEMHLQKLDLQEKSDAVQITDVPNLAEELKKMNPLYEQNKGWLTPVKVGINDTNETKKIIKKIYKRVKAKLKAKK